MFSVRYLLCIAIGRVPITETVQTQFLAREKFYASVKLAHARYSRDAFESAYTNAASDALFLPLCLKKPEEGRAEGSKSAERVERAERAKRIEMI